MLDATVILALPSAYWDRSLEISIRAHTVRPISSHIPFLCLELPRKCSASRSFLGFFARARRIQCAVRSVVCGLSKILERKSRASLSRVVARPNARFLVRPVGCSHLIILSIRLFRLFSAGVVNSGGGSYWSCARRATKTSAP